MSFFLEIQTASTLKLILKFDKIEPFTRWRTVYIRKYDAVCACVVLNKGQL